MATSTIPKSLASDVQSINDTFTIQIPTQLTAVASLTIGSQNRVVKYGRIVFVTIVFQTSSTYAENTVLFKTPYISRFPLLGMVKRDGDNTCRIIGSKDDNKDEIVVLYGSLEAGTYRGTFTYIAVLDS